MLNNVRRYDKVEDPCYIGGIAFNIVFNPLAYGVVGSAPANTMMLVNVSNLAAMRIDILQSLVP